MTTVAPRDVFHAHDHRRCRKAVLAAVLAECEARGLRLTPPRRCVLEALLEEHRAMTAYELLERLRAAGLGRQPPVVYRALDFLLDHGFAHRIERLSAFVACTRGEGAHQAAFLVCRNCRKVAEARLPGVPGPVEGTARDLAFRVERVTVEAEGLCDSCSGAGA
jgi:Fur family transcriptional regulator, zinc uptake regulator